MFELNPKRNEQGSQQSGRLLLALVLLLAALAAVLVKDRDFWFGGASSTIEAEAPETSATPSQSAANQHRPGTTVQAHPAKKQAAPAVKTEETKPLEAPAVTTTRTVLPPLDVEVVAGSTRKSVHPTTNSQQLEIADAGAAQPAFKAATNAADHQPLTADASRPIYPPLAQHMNVQGSVVLQALINADGIIQNIQILKGPAILARAAEQAVREWKFKPIVQHGQAVESKATITVNFTIKVADNSAETTVAEMQAADRLIISR